MEELLALLLQKYPIPINEQLLLRERWCHQRKLRRQAFLSREGETERYLYFVIKGVFRIYYQHQEQETCVGFAYDNSLICSYPSFILNKAADFNIQAMSNAELIGISRDDFYELFESCPALERCWRMMTEEALIGRIVRESETLTFTPEERYRRILKRSPHLFNLVPQKYIASYLNMTPETLSRVKRKFQQNADKS